MFDWRINELICKLWFWKRISFYGVHEIELQMELHERMEWLRFINF